MPSRTGAVFNRCSISCGVTLICANGGMLSHRNLVVDELKTPPICPYRFGMDTLDFVRHEAVPLAPRLPPEAEAVKRQSVRPHSNWTDRKLEAAIREDQATDAAEDAAEAATLRCLAGCFGGGGLRFGTDNLELRSFDLYLSLHADQLLLDRALRLTGTQEIEAGPALRKSGATDARNLRTDHLIILTVLRALLQRGRRLLKLLFLLPDLRRLLVELRRSK